MADVTEPYALPPPAANGTLPIEPAEPAEPAEPPMPAEDAAGQTVAAIIEANKISAGMRRSTGLASECLC